MSELKVYRFLGRDEVRPDANLGTDYYLKADADKTIANRDYEIEELKKSIGKLLKAKTEQVMDEVLQKCLIYGEGFVPVEHAMRLVADIRRHKYKRCLAMAEWCDAKADWYYSIGEPFRDCVQFYIKWRDKWLEIAEKFKPNKEAK